MRRPERIPIVLKHIPWFNFIQSNTSLAKTGGLLKAIVDNIKENLSEIERAWKDNPDMRLGQLLINLNLTVDPINRLWYIEEVGWLIENDYIEPREICFWTKRFTKKMEPCKPKSILIKDMDTDHIKAILEGKGNPYGRSWCREPYTTYFKNEIKFREKKKQRV